MLGKELLGDDVVDIGRRLDQSLALGARLGGQLIRYRRLRAQVVDFAAEAYDPHAHQIDHAIEPVLDPQRQLEGDRVGPQPLANLLDDAREIGAHTVHLVHEGQPRHAELVGLAPHRLGLRLDAAHAAEDDHRAVEHAQATLDLDGEIDVARRVDQVDLVVAPGQDGRGRGDRDAALLLLRHPVHLRLAVVDLADLVDLARVVQEALGDRGLARVDVRDDADVASLVDLGHTDPA